MHDASFTARFSEGGPSRFFTKYGISPDFTVTEDIAIMNMFHLLIAPNNV